MRFDRAADNGTVDGIKVHRFRVIVLTLATVFFLNPDRLSAQESGVPAEKEPSASVPAAPQQVDVNPQARDEEISRRLKGILGSTDWFESPQVEVDNGVVFLTGETQKQEYKKWASDLASNTQDVAAVVNQISIQETSIWDFSGAMAELREFRAGAVQALPFVLFGAVLLVATWIAAGLAGRLFNWAVASQIRNGLLRWVATRAVMLPILIFGVYLVLRVSGLTQLALTVLGGTGLIGLIIGIAFQDIAENFLASVLISVQQPFRIGDLIRVGEHEGIVDRVTTRGTTILTIDGNHVQIPNSQIYKNTIVNFTANPLRRLSFDVGIGYDDSAARAQDVVLNTVKRHVATLNDPPPKVVVESLGAATVNLQVLFWIDATLNDLAAVRSSVMRKTKQDLLRNEISLPDEAREVIFPKGIAVRTETSGSRQADAAENHDMPWSQTDPMSLESNRDDGGAASGGTKENEPVEEVEVSEAEGNLLSETNELKRQADQSWNPDEGQEILMAEDRAD